MSDEQVAQERPCLHCMMVELIDDYLAEYPAMQGRSDKVDTGEADEVIVAIKSRTMMPSFVERTLKVGWCPTHGTDNRQPYSIDAAPHRRAPTP